MLEVTLSGVNNRRWLLTGTESTSSVLAPMESLAGLVGTSSRPDVQVPGRSGVVPGVPRFGAIEAQLEFYLHADDGDEMERVYREFRQAWNLWSPARKNRPTVVAVAADHPLGTFYFDLWLAQPIAGVPVDMSRRTSATVLVDVFAPAGLARSTQAGSGVVTVTNMGDTSVYPKLSYSGSGGVVESPSGATFTLPPVTEPTVVDLDPQKLRLEGAFPEGVEPGESGVWVLPDGVTASWQIQVADPWA